MTNRIKNSTLKAMILLPSLGVMAGFLSSCTDWSDHFDESALSSTDIEIYNGSIESYMKSNAQLSSMSELYQNSGVFNTMSNGGSYSCTLTENAQFDAAKASISNLANYARFTTSASCISPSNQKVNSGMESLMGKYLWYSENEGKGQFDEVDVQKIVKADNGYVYIMKDVLPLRQSLEEYFSSLPDISDASGNPVYDPNYSYQRFKSLVKQYNKEWFNREASSVLGVDEKGQTIYDSVKVTRNTLLDRYTSSGVESWNMRDEKYRATLFVPTDKQLDDALANAYDSLRFWLHREPVSTDSAKFLSWVVKACFVNQKLTDVEVSSTNDNLIPCLTGYVRTDDEATDETTYDSIATAYWKPSVNKVTPMAIPLSNGVAYKLDHFQIPNHVVIYRVKSRFYQLDDPKNNKGAFASLNKRVPDLVRNFRENYFTWQNLNSEIQLGDDGKMTTWKYIYCINGQNEDGSRFGQNLPVPEYSYIIAEPTQDALDDLAPVSVTYKGLIAEADTYDGIVRNNIIYYKKDENGVLKGTQAMQLEDKNDTVYVVHLPAGEYYVGMGFAKGGTMDYSITIQFKGESDTQWQTLKTNMSMNAQSSNYAFDRGAASNVPHYGVSSILLPENYDAQYWADQGYDRAFSYETDGYYTGTVQLAKSGNIMFRIISNDLTENYATHLKSDNTTYQLGAVHTSSNHGVLGMYHWCLRPSYNNY